MFEYGIAGNGMPMGKADIGGGYFVVDGALYQYMGSVATYNDLLALDTTDFKPGYAYDVQEDGMDYSWTGTEWNSLGTHTDLSNYYTKDETYSKSEVDTYLDAKADDTDLANYYPKDETYNKAQVDSLIPDVSVLATKTELADGLAGKEDAFDLDAPLSMGFVTSSINIKIVDNLAKQNETPSYGIGQYVTGSPTSTDFLTASQGIYYSNIDTMDKFFAGGYIDVPLPGSGSYSFMTGNRVTSQNFVLGKGTGNDFIPIALLNPAANYAGGLYLNMSDTYSFQKPQYVTKLQISSSPVNVYSSFGFDGGPVTSSLDTAVSIDKTNPSSYTIHYNFPVDNNDNNWWGFYQVVDNASYISRLDEITTLRIFINDPNAGYNINNIGVYSYTGVLYNISKEQLGSNRVNIAGLINGSDHLQLSIGAGLAVQNGSLVNTNPAPAPVDQNYDGTSANAQSGTAVAEAISTLATKAELTAGLAGKEDAFEIIDGGSTTTQSVSIQLTYDGDSFVQTTQAAGFDGSVLTGTFTQIDGDITHNITSTQTLGGTNNAAAVVVVTNAGTEEYNLTFNDLQKGVPQTQDNITVTLDANTDYKINVVDENSYTPVQTPNLTDATIYYPQSGAYEQAVSLRAGSYRAIRRQYPNIIVENVTLSDSVIIGYTSTAQGELNVVRDSQDVAVALVHSVDSEMGTDSYGLWDLSAVETYMSQFTLPEGYTFSTLVDECSVGVINMNGQNGYITVVS